MQRLAQYDRGSIMVGRWHCPQIVVVFLSNEIVNWHMLDWNTATQNSLSQWSGMKTDFCKKILKVRRAVTQATFTREDPGSPRIYHIKGLNNHPVRERPLFRALFTIRTTFGFIPLFFFGDPPNEFFSFCTTPPQMINGRPLMNTS